MERILYLTNVDHGPAAAMTKLMADNGYDAIARCTEDDWHEDALDDGITLVIISQLSPLDYLESTRLIRSRSNVPIVVLSDRSDTADMVAALEMGADDYLSVPYERLALVAKIRALLRRTYIGEDGNHSLRSVSPRDQIVIGPLKIDCNFRDAFLGDSPIGLTDLEFRLLYYFVTHQEQLLSKEKISTSIWGFDIAANSQSLKTTIHRLKKKLREHGVWFPLESVSGFGYKLGAATVINLFPTDKVAKTA